MRGIELNAEKWKRATAHPGEWSADWHIYVLGAIIIGVSYFVSAKFGHALSLPPDNIAVFWPPNSIMLTALLLTHPRRWWVFFLAMLFAYFPAAIQAGFSEPRALIFFIANCTEVLIAAWSLRSLLGVPPRFINMRETALFLLFAVLIAPLTSACIATLVSIYESELSVGLMWRVWFLGDSIAHLTFTPLLLTWIISGMDWHRSIPWRRRIEVSVFAIGLFVAGQFAFGGEVGSLGNIPVLAYSPLPLLLWASVRFGPRGACATIFVFSMISIWNAVNQRGPFTTMVASENVFSLQLFLYAVSVPVLLLTSILQERKQVENNLRQLSIAVEQSPASVIITDIDGSIEYVNPRFSEVTGYTKDEVIGRNPCILKSDTMNAQAYEDLWKTILAGNIWRGEFHNKKKNGERYFESASISPVTNAQGEMTHFLAIKEDITNTKRLLAEQQRFNKVIQESLNEVYIFDPKTLHFIDVNNGAQNNLGYTMSELQEMTPLSIKPEFTVDQFEELVMPLREGTLKKIQFYTVHQRKDGSQYPVDVHLQLMDDDTPVFVAIILDITDRKRAEDEIQAIIETSRDWIWAIDRQGLHTYSNPAVEEILGYRIDEIVGKPVLTFIHDEDKKLVEDIVTECINHKHGWSNLLIRWQHKNGNWRYLESNAVPILDEQGKLTGFRGVDRDITDRKRAEEDLQRAKMTAETATRSKSEFLANMSHEIRTPMTAILGFAENMLEADQSESEKLNSIQIIRRNGEYLLDLINDILDLSKIEAGRMSIEQRACQPCQVIFEVASLMRAQAVAKGLFFEIECVGTIPETIVSDTTRLRQILINLISNAIKFTQKGSVKLIVQFVAAMEIEPTGSQHAPYLQFDVQDSGIGIREDHKDLVFKPFTQADASTTRKFGGTGLGLPISKRFAQILGGDITLLESEEGVGTCFRATIPTGSLDGVTMLENPISETLVPVTTGPFTQDTPFDLQGLHILLAEDCPDNQRLISHILKKAGAEVTVEENGKLAYQKALAAMNRRRAGDPKQPFDLILMDIQMPVMDGYEATRLLRLKNFNGPIIALTAHAMEGDREKCIQAGCDEYTTKPVDRRKLIELIQQHMKPVSAVTV